jgi:RimJ/RimL family protein N-acetyltransferase
MAYRYPDELTTARLITTFLSLEDVKPWSTFFESTEAIRFLFIDALGLPNNEAVAKHMIQKQLDRYAENRYGLQKLIHRETGAFIGCCGLLLQEVNGQMEIEVGYHIFPAYWGQGYATEAAAGFIEFAFNHSQANSIISIIDIQNIASIRVAEKNGLRLVAQTTWVNDELVGVYRLHNPQSLQ